MEALMIHYRVVRHTPRRSNPMFPPTASAPLVSRNIQKPNDLRRPINRILGHVHTTDRIAFCV